MENNLQSSPMPSNIYFLRNILTKLMKVTLLVELEIMKLKRSAWLKKKKQPDACNNGLYNLNHIQEIPSADSNQHFECCISRFLGDQLF